MNIKLKNFLNYLFNMFFPLACAGCGIDLINEYGICEACLKSIKYAKKIYCYKCGGWKEGKLLCNKCVDVKYYFERIYVCALYEGILRKCIHSFKYRGNKVLLKPLRDLLIKYIEEKINLKEIDFLVPVPLFKRQERRRGFNQALLLTKEIGNHFGKEQVTDNLVRIRKTKPQYKLNRRERKKNIKDAFMIRDADVFKNKSILLVDDICTTGMTLNECARILSACHTKKIVCLALAHG